MLHFQEELPRLPVPEVSETCELYLRLVSPLLTDRELTATRSAVDEFAQTGGPGELLQERLLRWSRDPAMDNWLDPFWDDWYLCDDTPLVVNVSPGFALTGQGSQVGRAARLLAAAVRFKDLVDREQLDPDVEHGSPRCVRDYGRICSSTRIPGESRDRLEAFPESRHAAVVRGNRFFLLDLVDEAGRAYAAADLEQALQRIVDDAEPNAPPVGVLTTDRRRGWAAARDEHLRRGPESNPASLAALEASILLLALESDSPPSHPRSSDAARLVLHGDARGRWFDKSIQLIVAANGVAGFCMEHAGFDGSNALRFAEFLAGAGNLRADTSPARRGDLGASELRFELTKELSEAIDRSARGADALLGRTDVAVLDFQDFGKGTIVRQGLSPDGFVQMAFQLAYFTLTRETASTYESVSTKRFLHGRTEAMRCVSPESVNFVRSLRGHRRPGAGADLLRAAIANHTATVKRCQKGGGVDRHLLGLRRMLEPGEALPALFADKGYAALSRSVLSTSALPSSAAVELTCFGPVVDEGFGLSYTIRDDAICCVVTNFHGLASAFAEELERGLLEMRELSAGVWL